MISKLKISISNNVYALCILIPNNIQIGIVYMMQQQTQKIDHIDFKFNFR